MSQRSREPPWAIDAVVAHLAELIERPLVLYDIDLNAVAYIAHADDVDSARRLTILSRRGAAREMMRAHHAASAAGPLRLPAEDGRPERAGRLPRPARRVRARLPRLR